MAMDSKNYYNSISKLRNKQSTETENGELFLFLSFLNKFHKSRILGHLTAFAA